MRLVQTGIIRSSRISKYGRSPKVKISQHTTPNAHTSLFSENQGSRCGRPSAAPPTANSEWACLPMQRRHACDSSFPQPFHSRSVSPTLWARYCRQIQTPGRCAARSLWIIPSEARCSMACAICCIMTTLCARVTSSPIVSKASARDPSRANSVISSWSSPSTHCPRNQTARGCRSIFRSILASMAQSPQRPHTLVA